MFLELAVFKFSPSAFAIKGGTSTDSITRPIWPENKRLFIALGFPSQNTDMVDFTSKKSLDELVEAIDNSLNPYAKLLSNTKRSSTDKIDLISIGIFDWASTCKGIGAEKGEVDKCYQLTKDYPGFQFVPMRYSPSPAGTAVEDIDFLDEGCLTLKARETSGCRLAPFYIYGNEMSNWAQANYGWTCGTMRETKKLPNLKIKNINKFERKSCWIVREQAQQIMNELLWLLGNTDLQIIIGNDLPQTSGIDFWRELGVVLDDLGLFDNPIYIANKQKLIFGHHYYGYKDNDYANTGAIEATLPWKNVVGAEPFKIYRHAGTEIGSFGQNNPVNPYSIAPGNIVRNYGDGALQYFIKEGYYFPPLINTELNMIGIYCMSYPGHPELDRLNCFERPTRSIGGKITATSYFNDLDRNDKEGPFSGTVGLDSVSDWLIQVSIRSYVSK